MFEDKYHLTKEENIFLAKKLLVASIYSGARIEGVNVMKFFVKQCISQQKTA